MPDQNRLNAASTLPSTAERRPDRATERVPRVVDFNAADTSRVPTLPFGTTRVAEPRQTAKDPLPEKEFCPFRFMIPELPADVTEGPIATTLPSPDAVHSGPLGAPATSLERLAWSGWRPLLGVIGVVAFIFTLLFWLDTPNSPNKEVTQPRSPVTPASESPSAILAQAIVPAAHPASTAPQSPPPSRAPELTTLRKSPTGPGLTVSKAPTALKKPSVLSSVLAPPPVD